MPHRRIGLVVLAVALAAACSGDNGAQVAAGVAEYPRPWANGPPGEALLEATSVDDFFLSYVDDVVADSEGRVYITDYQEAGVIALNADLSLDRTIGREGEGPGEFTRPGSMQVLPGDSLLVWDYQPQRITVFPPGSDEAVYVHSLGTQELGSGTRRLAGSNGYLVQSSTTYMAERATQGRRESRSCVMSARREAVWWTRWCTSIPPASFWSSGGKEPSAWPAILSDEVPSRGSGQVNKSHMRVPTPWRSRSSTSRVASGRHLPTRPRRSP